MRTWLKITTLVLTSFFFLPSKSLANQVFSITDVEIDGEVINKYIDYYIEPAYTPLNRNLSILNKLLDFKPITTESPRLGHKNTPIWFTLELANESGKDQELFFELPRQYFWQINLFIIRGDQIIEESSRGLESKKSDLEFPSTKTVFKVFLPRHESVRLLFYSITNGPIDLTSHMFTVKPFIENEYRSNLQVGIFYGIMAGLILYNFFIFMFLRDKAYLYYVLWAISLTLFFSTLNSVGVNYFWPGAGPINRILIFTFVGLFLFFEVKSLSAFLTNLDSLLEKKIINTALSISGFTFILALLDPLWNYPGKSAATDFMALCAVVVMMLLLYLSYRSSRKGFRPARFLIVSYLPFAIITILRGLAQVGLAHPIFHQNFIHQMGAAIEMIFMSIALADRINYITDLHRKGELEKEQIRQKNIELVEAEKLKTRENEVIFKTTQMLAHDVRKPFSILKMSLELIGKVKNMSELRQMLGDITPEVDRAMTSVNGMINDIMEIGRTSIPLQEPVSAESLIEASFNEVGRMQEGADISFSYGMGHRHMLFVDPSKVGRIFSNILGNAMQAMKGYGRIWIKTTEQEGMILFCLGNEGSFIATEDLPRLFDAFFTKDKKGGTGLGLAIAQKAVQAHGGNIWCESSTEKKTVEFFFTLPICKDMLNQSTARLPENSTAIIERYQKSLTQMNSESSINESASTSVSSEQLEREICLYAKNKGRPLKMAIVDDEAIYRSALMGLIDGAESLKESVAVEIFSNSQQLLDAFAANSYDFLICDIDLGRDSLNGYDIVKNLRQNRYRTAICIHSNRALPEDYAHSVEVGAQAFLPKPLSRYHLLKFMSGIIDREKNSSNSEELKAAEASKITPLKQIESVDSSSKFDTRDHIIYVDDEKVYRTYAPSTISDARVSTYQTPEEVIAEITNDQNFLSGLSAIITDQYFGKLSSTTGLEFAAILRKKYGFKKPIIINSNEEFTFKDLKGKADLRLPKKLSSWAEMKKMLPINPDDAKEPQLIIERKPHSELTELERASFSKLRHNVRGGLGGIELIIVNMKPNETKDDFSEKFEGIAEYFFQLIPYFPSDFIAEFHMLFEKLKTAAHDNISEFPQVYTEIKASLEKLKHHHYNDDWWKFDPQEEAKQVELARKKALIENPAHDVVINMENKELQQRIVTYAAKELSTTIVVTKDAESFAPIVITDSFDICGAALDLDSDVLMVEEDAAFDMIIKKLNFKMEIRSLKNIGEQNNV